MRTNSTSRYVLTNEKHSLLKTIAFGLQLMDLSPDPKRSVYVLAFVSSNLFSLRLCRTAPTILVVKRLVLFVGYCPRVRYILSNRFVNCHV